jgi:hypothetical protein
MSNKLISNMPYKPLYVLYGLKPGKNELIKRGCIPNLSHLRNIALSIFDIRIFPILILVLRSPFSLLRLRSPVFDLRSSIFGLPSSVFGLPSSVFDLPSSVFGLPSSVFRLPSSISLNINQRFLDLRQRQFIPFAFVFNDHEYGFC